MQDIINAIEPVLRNIAPEFRATFVVSRSVPGLDAAEFFLELSSGASIKLYIESLDWIHASPDLEAKLRERLQDNVKEHLELAT